MKLRCFHGNKRVDPEPVRMSTWTRKKKESEEWNEETKRND